MENEVKPWRTEKPNVFQIGGVRIEIAKKGRAQAEQIAELNQWLKEHIAPLSEAMRGKDATDSTTGWEVFLALAGEMTVDAQLSLAKTLLGTKDADGNLLPVDFIDINYDIDWVVDALSIAGKGAAAQRLLTSFFTGNV